MFHVEQKEPFHHLLRICARNGLSFREEQQHQLSKYVDQLLQWNSKVNLVSRKDEGNVWVNHILHALSLLFKVQLPSGIHILDLGTGGGLPGVPLAIARPDISFALLDSIQKKTAVLNDIIHQIGLSNVEVLTGRAEDLNKSIKKPFDLVVARAVASLPDLVKWSRPFLAKREGGGWQPQLVAYKGGDLEKEAAQARIRHGVKNVSIIDLVFDGSDELPLQDKKLVIVQF